MILRSIPPANRQPLRRISSMRAATATGFVMVGRQTNRQSAPAESKFQPKIVPPNPEVREQREMYYKAVQALARQLEELLTDAIDPGEITFWQKKLNQLKDSII